MFTEGMQGAPFSAQAASGSAGRALEGKEQFLKLLVAQISNQNPMNPMDDKDMVGQLAQFSAIEQAIETNTRLEAMEKAYQDSARLSMPALMGKEGAASTHRIAMKDDGTAPPPLAFTLDAPASSVTLRILDKEGKLVRSIDRGPSAPGPQSVQWDGQGLNHKLLPPGAYRMQITAHGADGAEILSRAEIRGKIQKIDMDGQDAALYLGNVRVPVGDLTELHEAR